MIAGCQTTLAGHCLSASPLRVIMVTLLGATAAVTLHEWYLEVRAR